LKKVLIADGLPGGRELLRILLEHEGYEVIEAADWTKALAMARATLPDLILVDLEQDGDGYRAVQEMRLDELLKDRPILAVTDRSRQADREHLVEAGFSGYIAKPVVLRTLREQLTQLWI
jgi:two-component system cell cycle response regulator DivK